MEAIETDPTATAIESQFRNAHGLVDLGNRSKGADRVLLLFFGIGFPEGEEVANLARFDTILPHQTDS